LDLDPAITNGLLAQVDAIRQMLACIEETGCEGDNEYGELCDLLTRLQQPIAATEQPSPVAQQPSQVAEHALESESEQEDAEEDADASEPPSTLLGDALIHAKTVTPEQVGEALRTQTEGDSRHLGELLVEAGATSPDQVGEAVKIQQESRVAESSIRVDVSLLDKLMNQVGELVLARNQVLQFTGGQNDAAFLSTSQRLNLITTELQEGVMKTRMQPIGNIWGKFPRVVRDLAQLCDKKVRIEMEGKETELDKTIIEAIKDPLTHLVRNACDHGLETPDIRKAAGKPEEGCLRLRAFHEGGQVNIEIIDDGAGLNLERIKQKAVERGVVSQDQAARLSERDTAMLIFSAGFSTAATVTNVSGRGVGMDVVKTNVERIGGTVDIQSQEGQGTTVKLKIPLTLAIIPALIVTCGGDRYAIPQVSLLELVRLEGEQAKSGIERLHGAPVYRLRGQLLPIVHLRKELDLEENPPADDERAAEKENQIVNIVVLRADGRQFGLVVDAINDTEEIVVKPLGKQLKGIPTYAGATIMGDGTVALIIDVLGTAQRARVVSQTRHRNAAASGSGQHDQNQEQQTLLILALGDRRVAIPISVVSRLEEVPHSRIERCDSGEVVQYRDQILPLIRLSDTLGIPSQPDPDRPLQVVVYREGGRSVGLVVDRITDIVDCSISVQRQTQGDNLLASAVIQDRVTDLLNLPSIIRQSDPSFFDDVPSPA